MRTFCVDSSVFLAALLTSDVTNAASQEYFRRVERESAEVRVFIPATVVLEVVNVLLKVDQRSAAEEFLQQLPSLEVVAIDDRFIEEATKLLPRLRLKTADAIVALTAALNDAMLVTWDQQLLRQSKNITAAATPDVAL